MTKHVTSSPLDQSTAPFIIHGYCKGDSSAYSLTSENWSIGTLQHNLFVLSVSVCPCSIDLMHGQTRSQIHYQTNKATHRQRQSFNLISIRNLALHVINRVEMTLPVPTNCLTIKVSDLQIQSGVGGMC